MLDEFILEQLDIIETEYQELNRSLFELNEDEREIQLQIEEYLNSEDLGVELFSPRSVSGEKKEKIAELQKHLEEIHLSQMNISDKIANNRDKEEKYQIYLNEARIESLKEKANMRTPTDTQSAQHKGTDRNAGITGAADSPGNAALKEADLRKEAAENRDKSSGENPERAHNNTDNKEVYDQQDSKDQFPIEKTQCTDISDETAKEKTDLLRKDQADDHADDQTDCQADCEADKAGVINNNTGRANDTKSVDLDSVKEILVRVDRCINLINHDRT